MYASTYPGLVLRASVRMIFGSGWIHGATREQGVFRSRVLVPSVWFSLGLAGGHLFDDWYNRPYLFFLLHLIYELRPCCSCAFLLVYIKRRDSDTGVAFLQ